MSFTTFLVDDDPGVLKALTRMMRTAGYESRGYSSARDFLREHDPSVPGCAIFDLTMPDLDGLELQQHLANQSVDRPIIFLTGNGDIPTSVRAIRAGAVDFLTKPVRRDQLLTAIARAEELDAKTRQTRAAQQSIQSRLGHLTPREREVLGHVIAGRLNKQIAARLGTVEKTVKVHRGRMMAKLGMRSVADLVRFAESAGIAAAE
jgi:FixJ family two-component response regulator